MGGIIQTRVARERTMNKTNTADSLDRVATMTANEASKIHPLSQFDGEVTIHCGGKSRVWQSKVAAMRFYYHASLACDKTSEGYRYLTICDGLRNGDNVVTDGIPLYTEESTPLTNEEKEQLVLLRKAKRVLAKALDELHRTKGSTSYETRTVAEAWNDVALKIIQLERRERNG